MTNPTTEELAAIYAARSQMFRPRWLRRLIAARLGLGETFWGGHYGMQLVLMPVWLLLVVVAPAVFPSAGNALWAGFFLIQTLWSVAVTQAVWRIAPKARVDGGWRWAAMGLSLLNSGLAAGLLVSMFVAPPFG